MRNNPNSFTIAHYLLLCAIAVFCIGIVAWAIIHTPRNTSKATDENVIYVQAEISPCEQDMINTVSQIWAYNPELIPVKYINMANEYANEIVTSRISGSCNDTNFVCNVGQARGECDPCAVSSGRHIAMNRQIHDMTKQFCDDAANK